MKKIIFTLLFVHTLAWAQHRVDKWYFGVLAGLDFTGGSPVAISPSAINTNEGCSSMSDSLGNLLFYSDGVTVWNRMHQVMPNGTGLTGGISATQSALIVPLPGSSTVYFIFTVDEAGGANGFRYSEVDMTLDGGNGDVTANKNIFILDHVTEKLTAVQHNNGTDYWIAVHEWGSDAFYVYLLTSSGLQAAPVISHTGIIHDSTQIQNSYGQMKFSSCGNYIALAAGYLNTAELFNFNNSVGVVSNPVTIYFFDHVYGTEFSPDANRLYVSTYAGGGSIEQFDLSSGIPATIIASQTNVALVTDVYALQTGPDGKIYVCKSFNSHLGVINIPNALAPSCNFVDHFVDLDPNFNGVTSALGLPGFVQSFVGSVDDCLSTGIFGSNEIRNENIFPNPAGNKLAIGNMQLAISSIDIFDITGRKVFSESVKDPVEQQISIDVSGLVSGIYFIKVNDIKEEKVMKFVKE
ncbi:MAG TPA: T9SS type A sorting domain-containing protein [Bacteroidia bacterium]|nr:T9SS type A sorting domain-containing protein [Bacteroidia bacterium]